MATSAFGSFYFTTWRLESLRTPVSRSKRKKQVYGGPAGNLGLRSQFLVLSSNPGCLDFWLPLIQKCDQVFRVHGAGTLEFAVGVAIEDRSVAVEYR